MRYNVKKSLVILYCIILLSVSMLIFQACAPVQSPYESEYSSSEILRLHIRANSNSEIDQQTKYAVRNEVLDIISQATANAQNIDEAMLEISEISQTISSIATQISGLESAVEITTEQFPTRQYDGEIIEAGEYQSIIINIGSGEGDNWWCVAFPPLCYIDGEEIEGEEIVLKSKIAEIWDKYI